MNSIKELFKRVFEPGPGGAPAGGVFIFAAGLAAYAAAVCSPFSFDPGLSLYRDSASFYWIQALWDSTLFSGDKLVSFYLANLKPWHSESLWLWPTALFMKVRPYAWGLKALAVLACAAAALLVRRLALASPARESAGAAAVFFTVLFLSMDSFFGVPRVYGLLLFLGAALALETRRFALLPAVTALCALVYPSASVGLAAAAALTPFFFREEFDAAAWKKYLAACLGWGALALLLLSFSGMAGHVLPGVGKLFESYKFYSGPAGYSDPGNPLDAVADFALNLNEHGLLFVIMAALLALVWGLGALVEPRRPALPRSVPVLLAGGAAAFLLLYPHHPVTASRQLVFAVPLALAFAAADALATVLAGRFRFAPAAAVCGLVFAGLHPFYGETDSLRRFEEPYRVLAALPAGSVLAGYPDSDLLVAAPVFTGKGLLLSSETADQELLFLASPAAYADRRRAVLEALYCVRPGAAERVAAQGARWLVVEREYYEPAFLEKAAASDDPLHRELAAVAEAGPGPEACYSAGLASAAYAWGDSGEGFLLDLAAPPAPADR